MKHPKLTLAPLSSLSFMGISLIALCISAQSSVLAQDNLKTGSNPLNPPRSVVVNGIAVVVNDEVITRRELDDRMQMVEQRLKIQGVALPPRAELQRQLIERMIVDKAQMQLAHESGLRVDDAMLDRAMERLADQNTMSLSTFRSQIEKEGTPYAQFRESVRDDILMQRLREREVESKIQVSESEVDNYLQAQKADKQKNTEVLLSHILVRLPENATPETSAKVRARAENVLQQVRSGADFSQLAVTYSDSPEGLKGGSLGWREQERYPQLFVDAITHLKEGESTGLIKSPNGFHIIKLTGRRTAGEKAGGVQQAHIRDIMIRVTPTMSKAQAIHKLLEFKQRLENGGSKFEDMAKQFSNDSSASKGGDLGWVYPGDIPEFDSVISTLDVGQVSDPVESAGGVHLIKLEGRKIDEVSMERQRLLARQVIRARKLDEATLDWLRQLRDRAYVEIRTEEK